MSTETKTPKAGNGSNLPALREAQLPAQGFDTPESFEHMQRVARMFCSSALVPATFQGDNGIANAVIALEMAKRMNASPLAVMQQIYIVHGKPSWSSQFIIACINTCGRYSPLRFEVKGQGDDKTCVAWAVELATGERLESPPVSIGMAKKEGWYGKNGSKWQTMPDLMLRYRAATFFGRLYAPELLMGMKAMEEVIDVEAEVTTDRTPVTMPQRKSAVETSPEPSNRVAQDDGNGAEASPESAGEANEDTDGSTPPPAEDRPSTAVKTPIEMLQSECERAHADDWEAVCGQATTKIIEKEWFEADILDAVNALVSKRVAREKAAEKATEKKPEPAAAAPTGRGKQAKLFGK